MNRRVALMVLVLAVVTIGAIWLLRRSRRHPTAVVPIQEGKTIDFSSGRPVVKNDPAEQAAIRKSVAEMDAAVGNVSFAPTAPKAGVSK